MNCETNNIFKPPLRLTRSTACLFKKEELKTCVESGPKVKEKRKALLKNTVEKVAEVFEKRLKSVNVNSAKPNGVKKQCIDRIVGVLTRNRLRSLLENTDFNNDIKKNILRDFIDNGYGTSSDTSRECAESVKSESRDSLESGFSDPCRLREPLCFEEFANSNNSKL